MGIQDVGSKMSSGMVGLTNPDGSTRSGWGVVDAPPEPPIEAFGESQGAAFGNVTVNQIPPGQPTALQVGQTPGLPSAQPVSSSQPGQVTFADPPPPIEKIMVMGGTGMGASKSYSMTESEAEACYAEIKAHAGNGSMSYADLAKDLANDYGIDAQQTTVDGHTALVNKATGDVIAVDTNGNGAADMGDMDYAKALTAAGVDVSSLAAPGAGGAYLGVLATVTDALEAAQRQRDKEQAAYDQKVAARAAAAHHAADVATPNVSAGPTRAGGAPAPGLGEAVSDVAAGAATEPVVAAADTSVA